MTRLSDCEFRACRIPISLRPHGCQLRPHGEADATGGFPEETWRTLYQDCGIKVWISGHGDDAERYAPGNLVPFAPKTPTKCRRPEVQRSGGSAA